MSIGVGIVIFIAKNEAWGWEYTFNDRRGFSEGFLAIDINFIKRK